MNPFDPSIFTNTSPCIPCCTTPTDCSCALLIPVFASPYMDLATAQAAVDPANGFVADCIAAGGGMSGGSLTYTATFDGTTLTTSATASSPQVTFDSGAVSISAKAGATLTFSKTAGAQIRASIYRCDGTLVENVSPGSGPITSSALPADDVYYVGAIAFNPPGPGSPFSSCAISMTSTNVYWVNPVIALWDDSGTTRSLWACPKLLLPPLTESTGDWYASCADAASLLATALVSGCVGYETHENQMLYASSYSFSATDGGSSLSYSFACTGGP